MKSFTFFEEYFELITLLEEEEQMDLLYKITKYMLYDEEPELNERQTKIFNNLKRPLNISKNKSKCKQNKIKIKSNQNQNKIKSKSKQNQTTSVVTKSMSMSMSNINDNSNNIFNKPSIEEIKEYCLERNNNVNPDSFYDFYESKNWMIGKNKMKDWKACVRTWEQRSSKDKITPSWFKKEIKDEKLSEEEMLEMEELLKEYRND